MSKIQIMPNILPSEVVDQNLHIVDEKRTLSHKHSMKNSSSSKYKIYCVTSFRKHLKTFKQTSDRPHQDGEFFTHSGRRLIEYDWKYGMKHIPVWKTNQLLNDNFYFKNVSPQQKAQEEKELREGLKLSAQRVNIFHIKPKVGYTNSKIYRRTRSKEEDCISDLTTQLLESNVSKELY